MSSPERPRYYEPSQAELRIVFDGIRGALESNSRLEVDKREVTVARLRRVFRTYILSGFDATQVIGRGGYDEILVETRTGLPAEERDMDWVMVELRNHGTASDINRNLEYDIHKNISYASASFGMPIYMMTKKLPRFDSPPADGSEELTGEEADLAEFVNWQMRSITPDDMALLQRLADSLST